jgi:hypothetical protein
MRVLSYPSFVGAAVVAGGLLLTACGGTALTGSVAADRGSTSANGGKVIRLHAPLAALAMDGSRVAYVANRVFVWNHRTGKTAQMSGRQADGGRGVTQLALAGTRVAWLIQSGGNEESDQDLYTSSLLSPKARRVLGEVRSGNQCGAGRGGYKPACAGVWLGGVVASGKRILVNRWTTDTTGAISKAGLYALRGAALKLVARGSKTVQAVAADPRRVAVLQWRWLPGEKTIHVYSATGRPLVSVTPRKQPEAIALSGRNLVVLTHNLKLFHYDARTGKLDNIFNPHGIPIQDVLAVQGQIAVYSAPAHPRGSGPKSAIRALNLTTGKDRPVAYVPGQVTAARMDSTGLVYGTNLWISRKGWVNQIVFLPFKQVVAAVS